MPARSTEVPDAPRSGGRRRGPSKGDLKEAAILDTAWQLLSEHPLSTLTIDQLARGAGISRSTFYFYFASRDAVIRALTTRVAGHLHEVVSGLAVRTDLPIRTQVEERVAAYLARWRAEGPVLRAMIPIYERDPELRAFWDGIVAEVSAEVVHAIERAGGAGPAAGDHEATGALVAALFAMMWRTGYEISLTKPSKTGDQRAVDALTTVWLRTLWRSDDPRPRPIDPR